MRAVLVVVIALGCSAPPQQPPIVAPPGTPPIVTAPMPVIPKATGRAVPAASTEVAIAVTGVKVTMNGIEISGKPMVADVIAVYGKPDRTWEQGGANKVHTWDRLGLLVYEPYDGRCISATFPYKSMSQTFDPRTLFAGAISVDGRKLTAATTLASVKGWPNATMPYSPSSVVFDKGDIHVFTIEEKPGTIDLVEVSFWQRSQPATPERPVVHVTSSFELECREGDARMCTRLALMHQTGKTADKDFPRAFGFAKQGCERGDSFGCVMLGNMHEAGRGTPQSRPNALAAWKRACQLGSELGCERVLDRRERSR